MFFFLTSYTPFTNYFQFQPAIDSHQFFFSIFITLLFCFYLLFFLLPPGGQAVLRFDRAQTDRWLES